MLAKFAGTAEMVGCGGAEPKTRPGLEKASSDPSVPQQLPMMAEY